MPTYEYRCQNCGHEFEEFQSIMAPNTTDCHECHESAIRKISGGAGLIFKGSGFYITDYKNKGRNSAVSPSGNEKTKKKPEKSDSKEKISKPVKENNSSG